MFNRFLVSETLKRTRALENLPGETNSNPTANQDSVVTMLIHDIFGGEILKTRNLKGWHFYNRIEGERIDFTGSDLGNNQEDIFFEDLPSSSEETQSFFDKDDYSTFFMKFIMAFEEAVGLEKHQMASMA